MNVHSNSRQAPDIRYAGLARPREVGLSVAETAERLRRLAYVERRLMLLLATRIVSIPHREIKALLARVQYEHAQHADDFRARVLELRTNKSKLEGAPDPALALLFDEAEHLPGVYPFMAAVTQTLEPALVAAYRAFTAAANELADYASVRLLRQAMADGTAHAPLLARALEQLSRGHEEQTLAALWVRKLDAFLAAAGGLDGTAPRGAVCPPETSTRPYVITHALTRDTTLARVWDYQAPPLEDVDRRLDYMMGLRLSEINVAEGLAIVLYETPDMPWSFYLDISRHLWDEMRHSLFGEAGIEATYGDRAAIPMRDYEGVFAMEAPPLEQYAVLGLEVEGKNMRYPPGKRQEWEFARDMARQPLMATLQDFDWADEVVHVNIARRQLDGWFEGGLKTIGAFSSRGKEHRTEVKHRRPPTAIVHPGPRAGASPTAIVHPRPRASPTE